MKKFRNTFEMEIDIKFEDEGKAIECYINSDWKDVFWDVNSIKDLSEDLALCFIKTPERWFSDGDDSNIGRFVEGFGTFIYDGKDSYIFKDRYGNSGGDITIKINSELEIVDSSDIYLWED